jgi:hypothetical protein
MTDDEMTPMPETTDKKQDTRFKPGLGARFGGRARLSASSGSADSAAT